MIRNEGKEFGKILESKEEVARIPTDDFWRIRGLFEQCSEGREKGFIVAGENAYFYRGKENLLRFIVFLTEGY